MTAALEFTITRGGIAAWFRADNTGVDAVFSHIAFGRGLPATTAYPNGRTYAPTGTETTLKNEFLRCPIAAGQRIAENEIMVKAMMDGDVQGWINEVGFYLSDGTLWALWSDPAGPLGHKGVAPYVFAQSVVIEALPLDNLTITATAPDLNLTMAEPFALIATALIQTQTHIMQAEVARLSAGLAHTWS